MPIVRWDPFQELSLITNRMNRLFQGTYGQGTLPVALPTDLGGVAEANPAFRRDGPAFA